MKGKMYVRETVSKIELFCSEIIIQFLLFSPLLFIIPGKLKLFRLAD